jgi:hypothetical protein
MNSSNKDFFITDQLATWTIIRQKTSIIHKRKYVMNNEKQSIFEFRCSTNHPGNFLLRETFRVARENGILVFFQSYYFK